MHYHATWDVYGLGTTLWEVLTDQRPFQALVELGVYDNDDSKVIDLVRLTCCRHRQDAVCQMSGQVAFGHVCTS